MRVVMFYHSLISDWNHGNAHFLRGGARELQSCGHQVVIYEPADAWSATNLLEEHGSLALDWFRDAYPSLSSVRYGRRFDVEAAVESADLVLVHEWNDHSLVRRIGEARRKNGGFRLLFHDTHHRAITEPDRMSAYDLSSYDGVLVFGNALRDVYLANGWADRVWVWHEAADMRLCDSVARSDEPSEDLVWIGNWGDEERTEELGEFLIEPASALQLRASVYGVRYPEEGRQALAAAGIAYRGWLPNFRVPEVFARSAATVHIPRRPYAERLRGIPTIRVFEALACGIPLVCAPWHDDEGLFTPGSDYLVARNGHEMREILRELRANPRAAAELGERGRNTVLARHTCAHRVDELLRLALELGIDAHTTTRAA
jgi:spore maturation protein CgeB